MFIDSFFMLVISFSRWVQRKFEPDVSQELREQIVNIIDDLVDGIVQGFLPPSSYPVDNRTEIYKRVYKILWREFGKRRSEYVSYRDEVFEFLREVRSDKFVDVLGYLLQIVSWIAHTQSTGDEQWARSQSVRDRHIQLFKVSVDDINDKLLQNKSKYFYKLNGELVQLVMFDTGLEIHEEESGIQENDDKQNPELHQKEKKSDIPENDDKQPAEHHQDKSRSEIYHRKQYIIAFIVAVIVILDFAFGNRIVIRLFPWILDYLQTLL